MPFDIIIRDPGPAFNIVLDEDAPIIDNIVYYQKSNSRFNVIIIDIGAAVLLQESGGFLLTESGELILLD